MPGAPCDIGNIVRGMEFVAPFGIGITRYVGIVVRPVEIGMLGDTAPGSSGAL
jgi:hypothetical protein